MRLDSFMEKLSKDRSKVDWKEIILSLIIPIAVIAIPFFINTPLLMYDVSELTVNNELKISIYNFGLTAAKNVIVSINTNNSKLQFLGYTSEPFLPISNNHSNLQFGSAVFKIDVLPPASETAITPKLNGLEPVTQFKVYVRSDEWVAYHHLISIGIVYLLVTALAVFILFGNKYIKRLFVE